MDDYTTVGYLRSMVERHGEGRAWQQSPREIAEFMAADLEELLDRFRLLSDEETAVFLQQQGNRVEVAHEIAELLYYVLALASAVDFDLSAVFRDRMAIAAERQAAAANPLYSDLQERAAS